MPNHTASRLSILGEEETIKELVEFVKGEGDNFFSFEKIKPAPDHIFQGELDQSAKEKYGKNNWYDWNVENWGTKWGAYDQKQVEIFNSSNALKYICDKSYALADYYFSTAWSPAIPVILELSGKYPKVIIQYSYVDEGYFFAGSTYFEDGCVLDEDNFDIEAYQEKYGEGASIDEKVLYSMSAEEKWAHLLKMKEG